VRVIGSIVDYVLATPDMAPLVERLAQPATRIVSLTITEGGYPVDEATGEFLTPPDGAPPPAFEALVLALKARRDGGLSGFTVLSCDNIMGNGGTARTATLGVCAMVAPGLEEWVGQSVSFPNGMVDRITPQTADADRELLVSRYGLVDRWPVVAEPFIQWVIEDAFPYGRPPYEDSGVLFTSDVGPYETLKLRILNAGHSCLTYLAALAGHVYIHEIMADPPFAQFLQRFHDDEATPSLPPVPGIDVTDYKRVVAERFANPEVRDQVARVCLDGTSKFPKFLIPTIESQLEKRGQVRLAALALAGWCQYLLGKDDRGRDIEISADPRLGQARQFAEASRSDPGAFLAFREVFGQRLPGDAVFAPAFASALTSIREMGAYRTLQRWLHEAS
ncbi:MAG TPA: mannitol dehydrogenase family protein, partial [Candidatus Limnocylindrales bacterium]|nr:mannitol dehydrogenase family protein [Candidatus Limnocylindrales bacterium]